MTEEPTLKIETTPLDDQQAKIRVEVPTAQMEDAKRRAARKLASRVKIPGFRPGKAPMPVVLRQIGESTVIQEALEIVVDEVYPQAIEQANIRPYGPGSLENVIQMDPPILEFRVPLEAEVELGDYRSLRQPYEPQPVADEKVVEALENLQERQAVIEPVDRPAQEGDLVTVKISAHRADPAEDQATEIIRETTLPVLIKSEESPDKEWPFPGFSRHLIGMTAGETLQIPYTFPEDAEPVNFRGVDAMFEIAVETVKSRVLPEIDDEFARSLGEFADGGFASLDDLRKEIRESLEAEQRQEYNQEYDEAILKAAIAQATFRYPPQMLEREIDEVVHDLEHRLERSRLTLDLYMKSKGLDMDGLRQEVRPVAESRLKRSIFLYQLAQAEKIELDPQEVQSEAINTMSYLSQSLPKDQARRLSQREVRDNLVGNVMADMLMRKTVERFRKICSGEWPDEESTKAETVSAAEEDADQSSEAPAAEVAEQTD